MENCVFGMRKARRAKQPLNVGVCECGFLNMLGRQMLSKATFLHR